MPLAGRQLSKKECAALAYGAGWTDAINLPKIVATFYAESNLYTEAWHWNDPADPVNPGDGSTDWGHAQLNDGNKGGNPPTLVDGHPRPVAGGIKSLAALETFVALATDPVQATDYARDLFERRRFQPWVAYNSGAYKEFIPAANVGVGNMIRERLGIPPA
jgi:hypothetical protein